MHGPVLQDSKTKIVATVGPACQQPEQLADLIRAGVDVFRINTAHGSIADHEQKVMAIRQASKQVGCHVGILLDLAGPKIRLGELFCDPLQCDVGKTLTFIKEGAPQRDDQLTSTYPKLIDELQPGNHVMLADGQVALEVESVNADHAVCRVTAAGEVRSRQGINLPGVQLSVSALQRADIENAIWAADNEIDFISLSFVRNAGDVMSLRNVLTAHESEAMVIAKIEKPEALENLQDIVQAADGVMVARGDLGVEIDVAQTPVAQKRIIQVCNAMGKPVIVATQMLESMHHSVRPTRAEASDVANAILDGADACMLSGETAVGDYPLQSVQMMSRILSTTEQTLSERTALQERLEASDPTHLVHPITAALTHAATVVAESIEAAMIIIATKSGSTAWVKSRSRSLIPTLAVSDRSASLRRMNLFWGIRPVAMSRMGPPAEIREQVCNWAKAEGSLKSGDRIVFVSGTGVVQNAHNSVVVYVVD